MRIDRRIIDSNARRLQNRIADRGSRRAGRRFAQRLGASPAKVKVTYEAPDAEVEAVPAPALSAASRSKPKKQRLPKKVAYTVDEGTKAPVLSR